MTDTNERMSDGNIAHIETDECGAFVLVSHNSGETIRYAIPKTVADAFQSDLAAANERANKAEAERALAVKELGEWSDRAGTLAAQVKALRDLLDGIPNDLRQWWSFDNHQIHTHSYHSREDYIKRLRSKITAATEASAEAGKGGDDDGSS